MRATPTASSSANVSTQPSGYNAKAELESLRERQYLRLPNITPETFHQNVELSDSDNQIMQIYINAASEELLVISNNSVTKEEARELVLRSSLSGENDSFYSSTSSDPERNQIKELVKPYLDAYEKNI